MNSNFFATSSYSDSQNITSVSQESQMSGQVEFNSNYNQNYTPQMTNFPPFSFNAQEVLTFKDCFSKSKFDSGAEEMQNLLVRDQFANKMRKQRKQEIINQKRIGQMQRKCELSEGQLGYQYMIAQGQTMMINNENQAPNTQMMGVIASNTFNKNQLSNSKFQIMLSQFNEAVKRPIIDLGHISRLLSSMQQNMPSRFDELEKIFQFMIDEGVICNISILLSKIKLDNSDLMSQLLWLLEDFSAGNGGETTAILDGGVIARLTHILKEIISTFKYFNYEEAQTNQQQLTEMQERSIYYTFTTKQICTILGNISVEHKSNARKEIFKFNIIEIMTNLLDSQVIVKDKEFLSLVSWFFANLSYNFDPTFLDHFTKNNLIYHLVNQLLSSTDEETYYNGLQTIQNFTNVNSDKAGELFVAYDIKAKQSNEQMPSLLKKLRRFVKDSIKKQYKPILYTVLNIFTNLLTSDDSNDEHLITNGLFKSLIRIMVYNNEQGQEYDILLEMKVQQCFCNLFHSSKFGYGEPILFGEHQWIFQKFFNNLNSQDFKQRREVMILIQTAMKKLDIEKKNQLMGQYNLIYVFIQILKEEDNPKNVRYIMNLLELFFTIKYSKEYLELAEIDYNNLNVQALELFFNYDGIEAVMTAKYKFGFDNGVFRSIVPFEHKFFIIDTSQIPSSQYCNQQEQQVMMT